jgi:adenosine deaminase
LNQEFFDLQTFFDVYYSSSNLLRTQDDFAELLARYLGHVQKEGVLYAEVHVDVQIHLSRDIKFKDLFDGLRKGINMHRE